MAGPSRGVGSTTDLATWDFRVFGSVEDEISLSYDELQALPETEITADIHCVTRWSRFDATSAESTGARSPSS